MIRPSCGGCQAEQGSVELASTSRSGDTIGLGNLDRFASIGSFSGGGRGFDPKTSYGGVFADPAAANRKIDLLWGRLWDRGSRL